MIYEEFEERKRKLTDENEAYICSPAIFVRGTILSAPAVPSDQIGQLYDSTDASRTSWICMDWMEYDVRTYEVLHKC
jgi:hypothetical protein